MSKCPNAKRMQGTDMILCDLYQNFCYLDEPNEKLCNEMYGDPYDNKLSSFEDDPDDGNPDIIDDIIDDEIGVDDIGEE